MGTALKFVKLTDVNQIPRYLLEQVKSLDFDIDRFYQWAPVLFGNPLNLFGGLIDKNDEIKGIMWTAYNPITNKLTAHILSVDKEYFGKGILNEAKGIADKHKKKMGAKSVLFQTTRPGAFEKIGFTRSQNIIMEN